MKMIIQQESFASVIGKEFAKSAASMAGIMCGFAIGGFIIDKVMKYTESKKDKPEETKPESNKEEKGK